MDQVRVLQFITPSGFYGAERWVLALANNIDHSKLLCDLAVTDEGNGQDLSVAEYYPEAAGQVHYLPMNGRFDFRVVSHLVKTIRDREIDVIHTHGYKSDILGLLAARKSGIKCVSTPHGFSGDVGFKLDTFIKMGAYCLRFFDKVAPLSEALIEDMTNFKVPDNKIRFIRNGVDVKEIDATITKLGVTTSSTNSLPRSKTIGFIGQMIPRKGIPDLLKAFDQLYQKDNTLTLQLLGDGAARSMLESMASTLGSADAIEFLGFRSDRLELLAKFDLFVMTSSLEGVPRCMMEAMAVGVPVAAYDIPGVDQLIEQGNTGLMAPYGDVSSLVDHCSSLLYTPELAAKVSKMARDKIDIQYSAARMAKEYDVLFRELLGR